MDELSRGEDIRQRHRWTEELHSESECAAASDSEALVPATGETNGMPSVESGTAVHWARRAWILLRSWFGSAVVLAVPLLLVPLPIAIGNDVRTYVRTYVCSALCNHRS